MKKLILSLVAVAIVSASGMAQEKQKPMKTPEEKAARQVDKMDRELTLTADQKAKIKEIILKRDLAREDLFKKYPEKNDAFREENKKLNNESEKEIKAILTPEQIEKQKQIREQGKNKAGGENAPPPPPPAPAPQPK